MKGGEEVVNNMIKYKPILYVLYGFAVLILFFLVYILFFKKKSNQQELNPDITSNPNITLSPTYTTLPPNTYVTTSPTNIVDMISNEAGFIKTDISKNIASSETILMIKGKLEDWGDNINELPDNLKEQAVNCYNNPNGCVF